jgi:hypothetical protein
MAEQQQQVNEKKSNDIVVGKLYKTLSHYWNPIITTEWVLVTSWEPLWKSLPAWMALTLLSGEKSITLRVLNERQVFQFYLERPTPNGEKEKGDD